MRVLDEGQRRRVGHERLEPVLAFAQRLARVAAGGVGQRTLLGDGEPDREAAAFDGLDDVVVGAGFERGFERLGALVGRDQQDDGVPARGVSPELAAERDAVLPGQPDVHDGQVEGAGSAPGARAPPRPTRHRRTPARRDAGRAPWRPAARASPRRLRQSGLSCRFVTAAGPIVVVSVAGGLELSAGRRSSARAPAWCRLMPPMKKLAIGCGIVLVVLLVGGAVATYFIYNKVKSTVAEFVGPRRDSGHRARCAEHGDVHAARVGRADRGAGDPLPQGAGAGAHAAGYALRRVQEEVRGAVRERWTRTRAPCSTRPAVMGPIATSRARTWTPRRHRSRPSTPPSFSLSEYRWVRQQAYAAIGMPVMDFDVSKVIEDATSGQLARSSAMPHLGGAIEPSGPEVNKTLVAPHKKAARRQRGAELLRTLMACNPLDPSGSGRRRSAQPMFDQGRVIAGAPFAQRRRRRSGRPASPGARSAGRAGPVPSP